MKRKLIAFIAILIFALVTPVVLPQTHNTVTVQAKKKKKVSLMKKYESLWKYRSKSKKAVKKYLGTLGKKIQDDWEGNDSSQHIETYIRSEKMSTDTFYVLIRFCNNQMMSPISNYDLPGDFEDYIHRLGFDSVTEVDDFPGL